MFLPHGLTPEGGAFCCLTQKNKTYLPSNKDSIHCPTIVPFYKISIEMISTLSAALALVSLYVAYKIYKAFRGPLYRPGMVAKAAAQDPGKFDCPSSMYSVGNASSLMSQHSTWTMPGGIDLFYFTPSNIHNDSGEKKDHPILCVHGGPSMAPASHWKLCEALPKAYLYHSRGCGKSTRPFAKFPSENMWTGMQKLEATLGLGAQVADIERIRRRLQLFDAVVDTKTVPTSSQEKLDLVGHSFGGLVATLYACEFPQYVRSLTLLAPASVLVMPPTPSSSSCPDMFQAIRAKLRAKDNNAEHLAEYEAFLQKYLDFSHFPKETEESLQQRQLDFCVHYKRATEEEDSSFSMPEERDLIGGLACFAQFFSMGMEHNYILDCQALLLKKTNASTFPVSIVHGGLDLMGESGSRQYQDIFPHAAFHVLPEAGHFLFDEPQVVDIVKETLNKGN